MLRRRPAPFLVLLLSLLLLFVQQGAVAHQIGHLGSQVETALQSEDGDDHFGQTPTHVCVTCLAYTGVDAGAPASFVGLPLIDGPLAAVVAVIATVASRHQVPYRSRAPPRCS